MLLLKWDVLVSHLGSMISPRRKMEHDPGSVERERRL